MNDKALKPRSAREEAADLMGAMKEHLVRRVELGYPGLDRDKLEAAREKCAEKSGRKKLTPPEALREIRKDLGDCRRCPLHEGRTNIVFGDGDPYSRIVFVGEAPGEDEDAQGVPFVGRAGKLLDKIIESGMGLKRSEVYIANVLKSRPPENRDPRPEEIKACIGFLERQIEAIGPKVIVALGNAAAHTLTESQVPISRIRGIWHDFKGIPLMPTFHPSYLLHSPSKKREVWEDIKLVMERLDIPIESKFGGG